MFGNFGPWELGFILLIVLMIFGPGKLPKVGESLGKAIKSFRSSVKDKDDEEKHQIAQN
ncbi:MAG TPA: twin-arginine translocase TatA/TatE family subunit [Syntrophomonas sp.]|nr:twin-arginine translocase TatA/TatE family subunit [Syntrophomonas sp.]